MDVDGFQRNKKSLPLIFNAFIQYNVNLVALSWLNLKTKKGKSPYLAPAWGLIYDANIDF